MSEDILIRHSKPSLSETDFAVVSAQLRSLNIATGEATRAFELAVADAHGYADARSCASGSWALFVLLSSMDIGEGDEVLISRYVCESVAEAIKYTGAKPVFYEVNESWQPYVPSVLGLINQRTRAMILVHIFGIDCSFEEIAQIEIPIIDDLCQAFGLMPRHQRCDAAFFSFNATKFLTTGEGGAYCASPVLIQQSRPQQPNTRLSDLQARLGLSQLERYDTFCSRRNEIATYYLENLSPSSTRHTASLLGRSKWFRFPVSVSRDFDELQQHMMDSGIVVRRGVDRLLGAEDDSRFHMLPTSRVFDSTVSLPIYPALSLLEMERVVDAFNEIVVE